MAASRIDQMIGTQTLVAADIAQTTDIQNTMVVEVVVVE